MLFLFFSLFLFLFLLLLLFNKHVSVSRCFGCAIGKFTKFPVVFLP